MSQALLGLQQAINIIHLSGRILFLSGLSFWAMLPPGLTYYYGRTLLSVVTFALLLFTCLGASVCSVGASLAWIVLSGCCWIANTTAFHLLADDRFLFSFSCYGYCAFSPRCHHRLLPFRLRSSRVRLSYSTSPPAFRLGRWFLHQRLWAMPRLLITCL